MSKFISNSPACIKSELDLFHVPPTNTSIETGGWAVYHPVSIIDDENGPLEFNIAATENEYIHLSKTLLYMVVEFVKKNQDVKVDSTTDKTQEPFYIKDNFGPVNNLASSLFSQIDVALKNESIETSNSTYAYKAYISDLLNYGEDAKNTFLQAGLFYKDEAGQMENLEIDPEKNHNHGYRSRRDVIANGKGSVELLTRLYSDIFNSDRYLLNGVDITIKLNRNKPQFYLMMTDDKLNISIKIKNALLFLRKAKISPQILLAHSMALEKATAKYPIKRVVVKTFTIGQNMPDFTTPNLSSTVLPTRVIVGMVDSRAFNGSYKYNPFNFQHFNLRQLQLTLDSKNIPYFKPLDFDFSSDKYIRGYFTLFEGIDKPVFMNGNDISRYDFAHGYSLFAFDISPDLCSGDHFNLLKTGVLSLELSFAKNLDHPVHLIVYLEFDNLIEITSSRKIIKDYQI